MKMNTEAHGGGDGGGGGDISKRSLIRYHRYLIRRQTHQPFLPPSFHVGIVLLFSTLPLFH